MQLGMLLKYFKRTCQDEHASRKSQFRRIKQHSMEMSMQSFLKFKTAIQCKHLTLHTHVIYLLILATREHALDICACING